MELANDRNYYVALAKKNTTSRETLRNEAKAKTRNAITYSWKKMERLVHNKKHHLTWKIITLSHVSKMDSGNTMGHQTQFLRF